MASDVASAGRQQTILEGFGENASRRRPLFVGREAELGQLESAFEAAAAGHGALILLAGEPGVGKTALCEELTRFVEARDGVALLGHCYPEGSAGVPYRPFVEAFEIYARERGTDALRAAVGPGAREVARKVPVLRSELPAERGAPEDPEDERLRVH